MPVKAKLTLILRGYPFQEQEIFLPDYDENTPFRVAEELRSQFVKWKTKELVSLYSRQIDKCMGIYKVYMNVESRGNKITMTEDEIAA